MIYLLYKRMLALLSLSIAAILLGSFFSALAPCGPWDNFFFGAQMWNEFDPGGYYIVSAHELYSSHGRLLYPGHPGLTLQILLHAVQAAFYALAAPPDLGFSAFIARNIAHVFFLSKTLISGLHALSFILLYPFSLRLLGRKRAALAAVFGYATSFPVVYYLSRVSVEPLMMVFFLASFLCLWQSLDETARRRAGRAALWAALAAIAAVSGLATKFHLLWPLPLLCLGQLFRGDQRSGPVTLPGLKARSPALLAFAAAALAALAGYSCLLDWRDFFAYWNVSEIDGTTLTGGFPKLAARQAEIMLAIIRGIWTMPGLSYLPGATKSGIYFLCELPMLAVAALGAVRFFRREGLRGRWLWLGAAVVYTVLIWAYHCFGVSGNFFAFHYLLMFMAVAAVFFGEACDGLIERLRPSPRAEGAVIALGIALIHQVVFWGMLNSRLWDANSYNSVRALNEALAALRGDERVALIGMIDLPLAVKAHGLIIDRPRIMRNLPLPTKSALMEALADSYVVVDRAELARRRASPAPDERPIGSVVEIVSVKGARRAIGPFEPARWLAAD